MQKVAGYIVSIVGIVVMALGFGMIKFDIVLPEAVTMTHVAGSGIVLIAVGVAISMTDRGGKTKRRKISGGENEVPIYEGTGKNRKVVGYRKD